MLTSKKISTIASLFKAIGNFIAELSEIRSEVEKQEKITFCENEIRGIDEEIKEIETIVEMEISKYPKNEHLKQIKEKLDKVRRGNRMIHEAINK